MIKTTNVPLIIFVTDDIKTFWYDVTRSAEKDLLETLILGVEDKRIWLEENFWDKLRDID